MDNFITWLVVLLVLYYLIKKRNEFNKLRRSVQHAASDIGIQKAKRTQCLNDALSIVKISHKNEVEGIGRLTASDQLEQLRYLGEKYPDLQSISGYNITLQEAFELDKDIYAASEIVNGNIRKYNDEISSFPGLIVAIIFRYKKEKFIDEENIEENKKLDKSNVDFSRF